MKTLTKEKQIITDEVEIKEGVFYFDIDYISYKAIISFDEDAIDYKLEILTDFSDNFGIRRKEDYVFLEDDLPYEIRLFIQEDKSVEIITEEWYNIVRKEILKRLL